MTATPAPATEAAAAATAAIQEQPRLSPADGQSPHRELLPAHNPQAAQQQQQQHHHPSQRSHNYHHNHHNNHHQHHQHHHAINSSGTPSHYHHHHHRQQQHDQRQALPNSPQEHLAAPSTTSPPFAVRSPSAATDPSTDSRTSVLGPIAPAPFQQSHRSLRLDIPEALRDLSDAELLAAFEPSDAEHVKEIRTRSSLKKETFTYLHFWPSAPPGLEARYRGKPLTVSHKGRSWELYVFDERTMGVKLELSDELFRLKDVELRIAIMNAYPKACDAAIRRIPPPGNQTNVPLSALTHVFVNFRTPQDAEEARQLGEVFVETKTNDLSCFHRVRALPKLQTPTTSTSAPSNGIGTKKTAVPGSDQFPHLSVARSVVRKKPRPWEAPRENMSGALPLPEFASPTTTETVATGSPPEPVHSEPVCESEVEVFGPEEANVTKPVPAECKTTTKPTSCPGSVDLPNKSIRSMSPARTSFSSSTTTLVPQENLKASYSTAPEREVDAFADDHESFVESADELRIINSSFVETVGTSADVNMRFEVGGSKSDTSAMSGAYLPSQAAVVNGTGGHLNVSIGEGFHPEDASVHKDGGPSLNKDVMSAEPIYQGFPNSGLYHPEYEHDAMRLHHDDLGTPVFNQHHSNVEDHLPKVYSLQLPTLWSISGAELLSSFPTAEHVSVTFKLSEVVTGASSSGWTMASNVSGEGDRHGPRSLGGGLNFFGASAAPNVWGVGQNAVGTGDQGSPSSSSVGYQAHYNQQRMDGSHYLPLDVVPNGQDLSSEESTWHGETTIKMKFKSSFEAWQACGAGIVINGHVYPLVPCEDSTVDKFHGHRLRLRIPFGSDVNITPQDLVDVTEPYGIIPMATTVCYAFRKPAEQPQMNEHHANHAVPPSELTQQPLANHYLQSTPSLPPMQSNYQVHDHHRHYAYQPSSFQAQPHLHPARMPLESQHQMQPYYGSVSYNDHHLTPQVMVSSTPEHGVDNIPGALAQKAASISAAIVISSDVDPSPLLGARVTIRGCTTQFSDRIMNELIAEMPPTLDNLPDASICRILPKLFPARTVEGVVIISARAKENGAGGANAATQSGEPTLAGSHHHHHQPPHQRHLPHHHHYHQEGGGPRAAATRSAVLTFSMESLADKWRGETVWVGGVEVELRTFSGFCLID
ncbi:hypothetical protein DFJ73DRAFT_529991 [Zopfochytrium polystomum]|nr:hypothetical protein DFJ73DRAFT_529991 [Zopfochytrium polystomum]